MCGISLIADAGADPVITLRTLSDMHHDLAGRGPDGEGWLVVDSELRPRRFDAVPGPSDFPHAIHIAAAFRRLAIRDRRREAAQPLSWRDGTLWVLHNGEIYNDADLRRDLSARGAVFTTGNDAETVVAAYEAWGEGCFERFRGMWATVIVDLVKGRLVTCRDRLGIKPLFYAVDGVRTLLASHPRTIALALASGPRLDPSRWHRFLRGMPADHARGSFFEHVRAVPAGSLFTIDLRAPGPRTPAFRRYWSLDAQLPDPRDARDATATELELLELLEASTREHLIADRTVGCLLSGGLDSSTITCLAAREARKAGFAPTCYSIVYDDPRMSEWPYIQAVAAHAGLQSVTHRLTPAEGWGLIDEVVAAQGEPLLGQDAIAQYRAFALAGAHGCVVALEGQAADEMFAGLPSYESEMFLEWLGSGAWGRVGSEARLRAKAQGRSVWSVLKGCALGPALNRWRAAPPLQSWLEPFAGPAESSAFPEGAPERSRDPSRLNRYLFNLVRHTNLPAVLLMQDRNAMAHGVENRPPFLDHRIVEWAFRLPSSRKVGGGRRKRVL